MDQCPVCSSPVPSSTDRQGVDGVGVDCPNCGSFDLSGTALSELSFTLRDDDLSRPLLSHAIRRMQESKHRPSQNSGIVARLLQGSLPTVMEQADNLVLWLGRTLKGPGSVIDIDPDLHQSILGATTPEGCSLVVNHLVETGVLSGTVVTTNDGRSQALGATLTFEGWRRLEALRRESPSSLDAHET